MTPEEEARIVEKVTEVLYRSLPEIVGNIVKTTQGHTERFLDFYEKYPQFKPHSEVVGEVVSEMEGRDPLKSYDEILNEAVPRIQKIIEAKGKVTMLPPQSLRAGTQ